MPWTVDILNRAKGKGKYPESMRLRASVEQQEMSGAVGGMNVGGRSEMNDIT